MKKLFDLLLIFVALATILSVISISVYSADEAELVISSSTVSPGGVFSVEVSLKSNQTLGVVNFALAYDTDLVSVEEDQCQKYDNTLMNFADDDTIAIVYFSNQYTESEPAEKVIKLCKITFKAKDNLDSGTYKDYITLSGEVDATNLKYDTVHVSFTAPDLNVSKRACGDIYNNKNDGKIDSKDAIYLLQYLAKMVTISDDELYYANTYVGDDNPDGTPKINSKDAIILLQYLARMDVTLGGTSETSPGTSPSTPVHQHTPVAIPGVTPTCQNTGLTEGKKCSSCGEILEEQTEMQVVEHSYVNSICEYCGTKSIATYTSYDEYSRKCTVSDSGNTVTLTYDTYASVVIDLDYMSFDANKTYVFAFGSLAGEAKFISRGITYKNVRFVINSRTTPFDLILENLVLENKDTIITSNAEKLNLTFAGDSVTICTTKGSDGSKGASYGAFQIGNGGNGGAGQNGNSPIVCSGALEIYCGATVVLKGGDGGNGGAGGNSDSSGSSGGVGGRGGNGAHAIKATITNVYFLNNKNSTHISISGGAGGNGGAGGYGKGLMWIGKTYASAGGHGDDALSSDRPINYYE